LRLQDYAELALSNLWKRKLRTFLTTFGVIIGIGALVSMVSFGKGIQRNVTEGFQTLELFNYITVFSSSLNVLGGEYSSTGNQGTSPEHTMRALDENALQTIRGLKGVESVVPDIRFPAQVRFKEKQEFAFVQALPAEFAGTELVKLRAGRAFRSDTEEAVIVSDSLLRRLGVKEFESVIGEELTVSTLVLDLSDFSLLDMASIMSGGRLPFKQKPYVFEVIGVSERMGMGGISLLGSDVVLSTGVSSRMEKLEVTNLSDFFSRAERESGYSLVNVKLTSPTHVQAVKTRIQEMGFRTFALIDQLEELKNGFLFMDMFLLAVGMIAIVVASLGIINTMVMSILERYSEIGVMKAVGAADLDIQKIFIFESSMIGFMGGIFGLGLGWVVSRVINQVANYFLAKQGVPFIEYFNFPWWICAGSLLFAVLVSLVSGIYPAIRAARVDPVVALRHD
jgi:putative ABC transport system permease protein